MIEQRPGAGTEVDEGSQVVIVIGVLQQEDTLEQPAHAGGRPLAQQRQLLDLGLALLGERG